MRRQSPGAPLDTCWSYLRNRWARDAGLCIDHLLPVPTAASRMRSAGVDRAVRGLDGSNDHAPEWVVLGP